MSGLYVFDAYGTLFDVHSAVARHAEAVGPEASRLSELWRTKQLEYTWVRSLAGRYVDFQELTEESLDYAALRCGGINALTRAKLLAAYAELAPFAEVRGVLQGLRYRGAKTAILSNGTPEMLAKAVASSRMEGLFDAILSVDALKIYKTAPAAYELVGRHFGTQPSEVTFLSSNRWDIAGATAFGFGCIWVNRSGLPEEYGDLAPQRVVKSLDALLA
jgi:2-haloacid dehalogenase